MQPMQMIGELVGSYRIVRQIGEGGMGTVYLAEHSVLGKQVAVKMLLPEMSQRKDIVQRFFTEARAVALLKHPGLVEIHDFGHHPSGSAFIVMELLEGESLSARLRREGRLAVPLALDIARQVATALGLAHERGIVHRDLKPDNVFLLAAPELPAGVRAKVLDFGIAKLTGASAETRDLRTRTGMLLGTPTYMSPEQCRGLRDLDHRSDIYALGCVLFQMVAGRPPFVGEGWGDILASHITGEIPSLTDLADPAHAALDAVVRRAMAKRPEERHGSMAELVVELNRVAAQPATGTAAASATSSGTHEMHTTLRSVAAEVRPIAVATSRRTRWLTTAAALVLLIGAAGTMWWRAGRQDAPAASVEAAEQAPVPSVAAVVPAVAVPAPAEAAPAEEAEPRKVAETASGYRFIIDCQIKAEVYRQSDGAHLGSTPYKEAAPLDGPMTFILRRAGFYDQTVKLDRDSRGTFHVELKKKPKTVSSLETASPPPPGGLRDRLKDPEFESDLKPTGLGKMPDEEFRVGPGPSAGGSAAPASGVRR